MPSKLHSKAAPSSAVAHRPLYGLLGLESVDCEATDISKAYRRLALKYHPDRNQDPSAEEVFKKVTDAYAVLSDPQQRRVYDATGRLPTGGDGEVSAAQRSAEVADQLRHFFDAYRGSAEERDDFAQQFAATGGDFKRLVKERLLFDNGLEGEVERLYQLGSQLVATAGGGGKKAKEMWAATTAPAQRKKLERYLRREREEAEEALHAMGGAAGGRGEGEDRDVGALQALMQQRQRQEWESMLADMESRYASKPNNNNKKKNKRQAQPSDREEDDGEGQERRRRRTK
eukprot:gene10990-7634_t